ncbi:DUF3035 domain-containing protein [Croceicoccus naphthovorans]|uniref:Uncharacterized protein n=1 Tax=Croceicoccus naphthovorans TaxID=1348774 RepID=A0A0G3XEA4_9SPHN|nr:DUF3035 domain-containing protein [Croceicoccus naphthovorans]AKM08934.1 hypothetical protein AB433_01425 [Croceicoccus naphthovorans]MBB3989279.1 hypothetical protein [Croceicoccus naphthovorans]
MRMTSALLVLGSSAMLAGCGAGLNIFNRDAPDEMAVSRQAPLAVPPDFALTPPEPGAPRPQAPTASQQALEALFGGPAARSGVETSALIKAGDPDPGIRSAVGDPDTHTVDKGLVTRDIIAAPEGDGREAQAVIPG